MNEAAENIGKKLTEIRRQGYREDPSNTPPLLYLLGYDGFRSPEQVEALLIKAIHHAIHNQDDRELLLMAFRLLRGYDDATMKDIGDRRRRYLGLHSEEYLKVFPENNNSMWGGIYDGEQMLYLLSFWTDGEGESDYWFHIPGKETYQEAQLLYPNFVCLRHMTGEQGNENGPFRHVAYDAEDGSVLTNEGTAANGVRVGTEVTTRTSGGEEWRLIYEYDQQGNLTNYVVNDSGDTIMFYEGTDINRSINVNNYPMQATVIQ